MLRTEDLLDSPAATRSRLLRFVGLPDSPAPTRPASSYAALHAQSLRGVKAQPMLNATRVAPPSSSPCIAPSPTLPAECAHLRVARASQALLEAFYRPHNQALASLLSEPALAWPRGSTVVDGAGIAGAAGGRKNFDRRRLQQM